MNFENMFPPCVTTFPSDTIQRQWRHLTIEVSYCIKFHLVFKQSKVLNWNWFFSFVLKYSWPQLLIQDLIINKRRHVLRTGHQVVINSSNWVGQSGFSVLSGWSVPHPTLTGASFSILTCKVHVAKAWIDMLLKNRLLGAPADQLFPHRHHSSGWRVKAGARAVATTEKRVDWRHFVVGTWIKSRCAWTTWTTNSTSRWTWCRTSGNRANLSASKTCPHVSITVDMETVVARVVWVFIGCFGYFCATCLICKNASDLGESTPLYCLLACCIPTLGIFMLRQRAREMYGIEVSFEG